MSLGLRAKSLLVFASCILLVLLLAAFVGGRTLAVIETNLGTAYARNLTQYNKQKILAPVSRELALSQRLADSELTQRFLLDEANPEKKALFFGEAERYRQAFDDKSYFLISALSYRYYFNDPRNPFSTKPHYTLNPAHASDDWFFASLRKTEDYNINVDYDVKLKLTKVWFNVVVKDGQRKIGMAGTGLDLSEFLKRYITSAEPGVTPIIVNRTGAIQAYPDEKLIDYSSVNDKRAEHSTLFRLLKEPKDAGALKAALQAAETNPEGIQEIWVTLNGHRELLAISYIPELEWNVVTAVNLSAARVVDRSLWLPPLIVGAGLLVLLLGALLVGVNRLLLNPVLALTGSVRKMAGGNYDVELPPMSNDELGELTRAFGVMATQVLSHTNELEHKVAERTSELVAVNKQIGASIEYASLIQNAILPNLELTRSLGDDFFVLWRPRDVVGGDFYVFRSDDDGYLLGLVDCAGHGVPGACMTMLAYAALNFAIDTLGIRDPAAILTQMDAKIRTMISAEAALSQVATQMDAGLVYVDRKARQVIFAGAKVSLYWASIVEEGGNGEVKGERQAVGGKRIPKFTNKDVKAEGEVTFYLTSDGLLDQAGGPKGFSFGLTRFVGLMQRNAHASFQEQCEALSAELAQYQGDLPQRDDITVLAFRFADETAPREAESTQGLK